jgi:hypothetical protein
MINLIRYTNSGGFCDIEPYAGIEDIKISDSKDTDADYIASSDFYPTYSAWGSAIGSASVILTVWEHADQLVGNNLVAFLDGRSRMNKTAAETWPALIDVVDEDTSLGLTSYNCFRGINDLILPEDFRYFDAFLNNAFDVNTYIWDMIKKYDIEAYSFAIESKPRIIMNSQFMCTRQVLDVLGYKLLLVVERMRIRDVGMWTEKFISRLLGIYLAQLTVSVYTTAFWHHEDIEVPVSATRFLNIKPKIITMNSKKL